MRTYTISHTHANQKSEALDTLNKVLQTLELSVQVPPESQRLRVKQAPIDPLFDMLVSHSTKSVTAVIHVYKGKAPLIQGLRHLLVTDSPDRYEDDFH